MPQHLKITKVRVDDFLHLLEHANQHAMLEDGEPLLRLLPELDSFLVKHDRTDLARKLRKAFDRLEGAF